MGWRGSEAKQSRGRLPRLGCTALLCARGGGVEVVGGVGGGVLQLDLGCAVAAVCGVLQLDLGFAVAAV